MTRPEKSTAATGIAVVIYRLISLASRPTAVNLTTATLTDLGGLRPE